MAFHHYSIKSRSSLVASFLLIFIVLAGCAQKEIGHQSQAFNQSLATTMPQLALLNVVRASRDMPLSFTNLSTYEGGARFSGTTSPDFKFGPDFLTQIYSLAPVLNVSSGVSQITYGNSNVGGANVNLNKSLDVGTLDRYVQEGVHYLVMTSVLIAHVEVDQEMASAMLQAVTYVCDEKKLAGSGPSCDHLRQIRKECGKRSPFRIPPFPVTGTGHAYLAVDSRAVDRCDFLTFSAFNQVLLLTGFNFNLEYEENCTREKNKQGKVNTVCNPSPKLAIVFLFPKLNKIYRQRSKALAAIGRKPIQMTLRTPRGLYKYLGDLVRLQNDAVAGLLPQVFESDGTSIPFFTVKRGREVVDRAAISVRGPFGQHHSVAIPDYGTSYRDQTLRVLTIAAEVANTAIGQKDLPAPRSIAVRTIQ